MLECRNFREDIIISRSFPESPGVGTAGFENNFIVTESGGKLVIVGTRKDLEEALALAARGLVRCNYTTAVWKTSTTYLRR